MSEENNKQNDTSDPSVLVEGYVSLQLTARELRLLKVAAWRFMNAAYQNIFHATQKRPDVTDEEAKQNVDAFLRDVKDLEALVQKLSGILQANEITQAHPKDALLRNRRGK